MYREVPGPDETVTQTTRLERAYAWFSVHHESFARAFVAAMAVTLGGLVVGIAGVAVALAFMSALCGASTLLGYMAYSELRADESEAAPVALLVTIASFLACVTCSGLCAVFF